MVNAFLFHICLEGIEYIFEILLLLLLLLLPTLISWTYAKLKNWFINTMSTNKNTGKHKYGGSYSYRIVCFVITVNDVVKTSLFRIFLQKIGEIVFCFFNKLTVIALQRGTQYLL
jgi:hypothetical protein